MTRLTAIGSASVATEATIKAMSARMIRRFCASA